VTYRVIILPPALDDMELAHRRIKRESPMRADTWVNGAERACQTLSEMPRRCPLAPENDSLDYETRQLLYGAYRILFTIEDDTVLILHVRHGARRSMTPDEMV
jgi:plasmid stabilization system protein ParE